MCVDVSVSCGLRASAPKGKGAAALAEREAQLDRLEADAKAKLAEAERMVDESMMAAVKQQQERKALQDEVTQSPGMHHALLCPVHRRCFSYPRLCATRR